MIKIQSIFIQSTFNVLFALKSDLEKEINQLKATIAGTPSPKPNWWSRLKGYLKNLLGKLHWRNLTSWKGILTWFIGLTAVAKLIRYLYRFFLFIFTLNFGVILSSLDWTNINLSVKFISLKLKDLSITTWEYLLASYKNLYKNIVSYLFGNTTEVKSLKDHYDATKVQELRQAKEKLVKKIINLKRPDEPQSLQDRVIININNTLQSAQSNWKWVSVMFGFAVISALVVYKLYMIYISIFQLFDGDQLVSVTRHFTNILYGIYALGASLFAYFFRGNNSTGSNPNPNPRPGLGGLEEEEGQDIDIPETPSGSGTDVSAKRYFVTPPNSPWVDEEEERGESSDDTVKPDKGKGPQAVFDYLDFLERKIKDMFSNLQEFKSYLETLHLSKDDKIELESLIYTYERNVKLLLEGKLVLKGTAMKIKTERFNRLYLFSTANDKRAAIDSAIKENDNLKNEIHKVITKYFDQSNWE